MLRLRITNICTFQHGQPGYLGALQKMSHLNGTSYSYKLHFIDIQNDNIRENMSDFKLTSVKTV